MKLPMKVLLYTGDQHIGGDREEDESLALKAVVKKFFYPVRGRGHLIRKGMAAS